MGETMVIPSSQQRQHGQKAASSKAVYEGVKVDVIPATVVVTDVVSKPEERKARSVVSRESTASTASMSSSSSLTTTTTEPTTSLDDAIADTIGKALDSMLAKVELIGSEGKDELFNNPGGVAPVISVRSYLCRILRYIEGDCLDGSAGSWDALSAGACALFSSLIYVDRIVSKARLHVSALNVHRLLAVGILVALKSQEDSIVQMDFFAALAGVSLKELLRLESAFLQLLGWEVVIGKPEFDERVTVWRKFVDKARKVSSKRS